MRLDILNEKITELFADDSVCILREFFRADDLQLFVAVRHEKHQGYYIFYEADKNIEHIFIGNKRKFNEVVYYAYNIKPDLNCSARFFEAMPTYRHNKAKNYMLEHIVELKKQMAALPQSGRHPPIESSVC